MTRWFRMYDEILDDPKVQKLDADDFRAWVNLLCIASKNGGVLPSVDDIAFALRRSLDDALTLLGRLLSATLIDKRSGGADGFHYVPHGWDKRQYKSDASTERVKRFRERSKTVSETGPEPDTESDTEQSPPNPPQTGGSAGPVDPLALASDLCRVAGIGKAGTAAVGHVKRWLGSGISEATIRATVAAMTRNAGGRTLSLKRFDQPVRRAHAERRVNGTPKPPETIEELERAAEFRDSIGEHEAAEGYRRRAASMRNGEAIPVGVIAATLVSPPPGDAR